MSHDAPAATEPLLILAPETVTVPYRSWGGQALEEAFDFLQRQTDTQIATYRNARELPHLLARRGKRRLVLVCNDLNLNALVQELHRHRALSINDPIGLLPAGPGNEFAHNLGLPLDLLTAAHTVVHGQPRTLDLLVDELGGVVVHTATIGIAALGMLPTSEQDEAAAPTAHAQRAADQVTRLSTLMARKPSHHTEALTVHPHRGWSLRILVDDAQMWDTAVGYDGIRGTFDDDARVFFVEVGNGTSLADGIPLLANTRPDDGYLNVVVSVAAQHAHVAPPSNPNAGAVNVESVEQQVRTARGRRVSVLSREAAFTVMVDGQAQTGVHARTWRVEPAAWSVLAPALPAATTVQ